MKQMIDVSWERMKTRRKFWSLFSVFGRCLWMKHGNEKDHCRAETLNASPCEELCWLFTRYCTLVAVVMDEAAELPVLALWSVFHITVVCETCLLPWHWYHTRHSGFLLLWWKHVLQVFILVSAGRSPHPPVPRRPRPRAVRRRGGGWSGGGTRQVWQHLVTPGLIQICPAQGRWF